MQKKMLTWILFLLGFYAASAVFSEGTQRIVPLERDAYRYLRGIALEAGILPPSASVPYSISETKSELHRVVATDRPLSGAAVEAQNLVRALWRERPIYSEPLEGQEGFNLFSDLRINLEGYFHTNQDFDRWVYGFKDRQPFVGGLFEGSFFDSLALYIDLTVQKDPFQAGGDPKYPLGDPDNFTNILTSPNHFDLNIPYRAGISLGGDRWNLWLGRDRLSWGNGRTGNLLLSDADIYHEGVRFTTWWRSFKITFLLLGLESWRMVEADKPYPWPDRLAPGETVLPPERFKMFLAHRFEFNLTSNLRLTLNESIVYGGKYPDLRIFNPLIIYHNLYIRNWANSLMTLELDYVPFPGVYLYGQYALDQLATIFEKVAYGKDDEPNAMGFLLGLELQKPMKLMGQSGWLRGGYEFVRTDPWLYIRESPFVSFFSTRRIQSEARKMVTGDRGFFFMHTPLGYPQGPDMLVNNLWVSYEAPGSYRVCLEYSLVLRGENRVTTPFQTGKAAWEMTTPSGTEEVQNLVTLSLQYVVSPSLDIIVQPSFLHIENFGHQEGLTASDFQLAFGVRYRPLATR